MMLLALAATASSSFSCTVTRVHDGDGPIWCASGIKVRVAGVQAPDFESAEPCRLRKAGYVCDDQRAAASRGIAARLVTSRTLRCHQVGKSYSRVVATCRLPDGRDLSCTLIATGAAHRWDSYWRRYRMPACPAAGSRL